MLRNGVCGASPRLRVASLLAAPSARSVSGLGYENQRLVLLNPEQGVYPPPTADYPAARSAQHSAFRCFSFRSG